MKDRIRTTATDLFELGRAFWRWWRTELQNLLPARWRFGPGPRIEIRCAENTTLQLVRRDGHSETGLFNEKKRAIEPADFAQAIANLKYDLPIWLFPSADDVLSRTIQLPKAALPHFYKLLPAEIDRWTPYAADEIVVAWKAAPRDSVSVDIELRYIPRQRMTGRINSLVQIDLVPTIVVLGDDTAFRTPDVRVTSPIRQARIRNKKLAAAALVLASAVFVLTDWQTAQKERRVLQDQIKHELRDLEQQRALQQRLSDVRDLIDDGSRQSGLQSHFLRALAAAVPPTDWLTELSIRSRSMTLRGYSANPDLLIKALEPLALRKDVLLQGELATDVRLARQRFALAMRLPESQQ